LKFIPKYLLKNQNKPSQVLNQKSLVTVFAVPLQDGFCGNKFGSLLFPEVPGSAGSSRLERQIKCLQDFYKRVQSGHRFERFDAGNGGLGNAAPLCQSVPHFPLVIGINPHLCINVLKYFY